MNAARSIYIYIQFLIHGDPDIRGSRSMDNRARTRLKTRDPAEMLQNIQRIQQLTPPQPFIPKKDSGSYCLLPSTMGLIFGGSGWGLIMPEPTGGFGVPG